jgi:hypothetical protein
MLAKTHNQIEQAAWLGSGLERRTRSRLKLAIPVVLFRPEEADRVETKTEDISCDSFYCISDRQFSPGDLLECELIIPGDELSSVPEQALCLCCRVRVVRVVARGLHVGFGVACRLEDYTISRGSRESNTRFRPIPVS